MAILTRRLRKGSTIYTVVDPIQLSDTNLNDSSKDFVVPSNTNYRLLYGNVNYVSTATVGDRQLELQILDGSSNIVYKVSAGVVQAASLTVDYSFVPGAVREGTVFNGELIVPIVSDLYIPSAFTIRVIDSAAVDAAADDMIVRLMVETINLRA